LWCGSGHSPTAALVLRPRSAIVAKIPPISQGGHALPQPCGRLSCRSSPVCPSHSYPSPCSLALRMAGTNARAPRRQATAVQTTSVQLTEVQKEGPAADSQSLCHRPQEV
jgi:hypothetical protein